MQSIALIQASRLFVKKKRAAANLTAADQYASVFFTLVLLAPENEAVAPSRRRQFLPARPPPLLSAHFRRYPILVKIMTFLYIANFCNET